MNAQQIEQTILNRPLPELLPADQGWVMPHYAGLSIANLPATLAGLFGLELPGALPALPREAWADWQPGLRRVVLVVLDALGYRLLQRMVARGQGQVFAELGRAGQLLPLTSVFPSTTDAALLSLRTGRAPAEHGWLAYFMYLREMGLVANAVLLCPAGSGRRDLLVEWGLDPETLVSVPSLAERLAEAGVVPATTLATYFAGSGFTQMLNRGITRIWRHRQASDLWVQLRHALAETRGQRLLLTAYWSGLDTLGHAYGQDTDLWEAEFQLVSYLLEQEFLQKLPAEDRRGTLFLITADHGQVVVPPGQILTVEDDPALGDHLLIPIVGESRAAFVYPRAGRSRAFRQHLATAYPGWFTAVDSAAALEAGLMGKPIAAESYARAGELLVLAHGHRALQQSIPKGSLLGRHGGLTEDEMLVPLIGTRLEALA